MAKINWVFQDESGTNLNRYIATNVETGEQITFDLLRGGNISIIGTPLNAEKLNQLVNAINENYNSLLTLATQVSGNSNDIDELKTTTTNIGKAVDSVTKSVATNTSDISTNKTNIATNKSNIATNTNDIAGIKSTISGSLSGQINSALKQANENKSAIATNKTNIATNTSDISELETRIQNIEITNGFQSNSISTHDTEITNIKTRLDNLGFKSGTLSCLGLSPELIVTNTITKQGKMCIFSLGVASPTVLPAFSVFLPADFSVKKETYFVGKCLRVVSGLPVVNAIEFKINAGSSAFDISSNDYTQIVIESVGLELE